MIKMEAVAATITPFCIVAAIIQKFIKQRKVDIHGSDFFTMN
jgi:hypothetical protein